MSRRNIVVLLPLVLFLALAGLFFFRLGTGDPSRIPSALIGRPVPQTTLPALAGLTRDGLPIGLQLVGPMFGDALVLRAARAYESVRPIPRPDLTRVA